MTFSIPKLSALCRDFCKEFDAAAHESELFLAQFHTEDRFRFSNVEQIKNAYLAPYGNFIASLLASLERTDRLSLRLSALLLSTDSVEAVEHQAKTEALWQTYEQYRADVSQYCECTQKYWTDKNMLATQGTAPLVFAMRTLIAAQHRASEAFAEHIQ